MTGWMIVVVGPLSPGSPRRAGGGVLVVPAAGLEVVAYPGARGDASQGVLDEHFAVDAGQCSRARWLQCADVLYTCRRRSWAAAVGWLSLVTEQFPGCRLAAAALEGGGWAVQSGADGVPARVASACRRAAVASCVHGWIVAGGSLEDLEEVQCVLR